MGREPQVSVRRSWGCLRTLSVSQGKNKCVCHFHEFSLSESKAYRSSTLLTTGNPWYYNLPLHMLRTAF